MKLDRRVGTRGWLVTVPLLLLQFGVFGQIRFSEFYEHPSGGAGTLEGVILLDDGSLMATGNSLNIETGYREAHRVRINGEGLLLNESVVASNLGQVNSQAIIRSSFGSGIYESGYFCDYSIESPGYCDFYLTRLDDTTGDTLFMQVYAKPDTGDLLLNMVETRPNRVMLIGWTYDDTTNSDADILLITVDTLGNEVNRVVYGGGGTDYIHSGTVINESGDVFMTGYTASFQGSDNDTWLIKTDSIGNVQWQITYNHLSASGGDGGLDIERLQDGNFVVVGFFDNPSNTEFWAFAMKIDADGNEIWTRRYENTFSQGFWACEVLNDGSIVATGQTSNTNIGSVAGWMVKTDANGDTLWTRTFNPSGAEGILRNMLLMPNGDIVMVGFGFGPNSSSQDGWILRVDSMGCVIENCFTVGVEELEQEELYFKAYPNPFTNSTTIEYDLGKECETGCELRLYDLQGRVILQQMLWKENGKGRIDVDMSHYTNGVYYCGLYGNQRLLQTEKLILMR